MLVVAPLGTGKTALAARLAARDADRTEDYERVLLLTFSNQARRQLEAEVHRTLSPGQKRRVVVTNYHSFFWRTVNSYRAALGLPSELRMSSQKRREAILRGVASDAVDELGSNTHAAQTMAEQAHPDLGIETPLATTTLDKMLGAITGEHERGYVTFGDFGALFWTLYRRYPSVKNALRSRYPFVIADEHQDVSASQDALVMELGGRGRTVLADPMQLIYDFRGASLARFEAHRERCTGQHALTTPHRWHRDSVVGDWLLDVRSRLKGTPVEVVAPSAVSRFTSNPDHGTNGMKPGVRNGVAACLSDGCRSVAVLALRNDDVASINEYLSDQGFYPRHMGVSPVLESSLQLVEDLPEIEARELVDRALLATYELVPSVPTAVRAQVAERLGPTGLRKSGCGP